MSKEIKSIYITFLISVISIITHNYLYWKLGKEEGVFFVLAFLGMIAFVFAIIAALTKLVTEKKSEDLWITGFLGLFGLLGFVPDLGQYFFGFFGFFLFFVLKFGYSSKIVFKNILIVIALIGTIGGLGANFYKTIQTNQDNVYELFKFMQSEEMLKGIPFTKIEKKTFYWPSRTEPIIGKGFEEMTVTMDQADTLRNFFEAAEFEMDFFDIESTTNAGVSGYKKDNVWCVFKYGLFYDEKGDPIQQDKMRCNIYCAEME
jgi:hypothetical protein